jgi:ubiquinone/menaquinone biosynthesis C-methylase UbiE
MVNFEVRYEKELSLARQASQKFIEAAQRCSSKEFSAVKAYLVINIWLWHADNFPNRENQDPLPGLIKKFETATQVLELIEGRGFNVNHYSSAGNSNGGLDDEFEQNIGNTFRDIWLQMTDDIYFDQCFEFTKSRYERNDVDPYAFFGGKVVLDAGCGSGKVTSAIAKFGAKEVIGIDLTEEGLEFARNQAHKIPEGNVISYRLGSTYDIPLSDKSVDIVHSNGVVHHTINYESCISEYSRVLKPGGYLYIFVMGRSGLFEILADTVRVVCESISRPLFIHYLQAMGMNSGRLRMESKSRT